MHRGEVKSIAPGTAPTPHGTNRINRQCIRGTRKRTRLRTQKAKATQKGYAAPAAYQAKSYRIRIGLRSNRLHARLRWSAPNPALLRCLFASHAFASMAVMGSVCQFDGRVTLLQTTQTKMRKSYKAGDKDWRGKGEKKTTKNAGASQNAHHHHQQQQQTLQAIRANFEIVTRSTQHKTPPPRPHRGLHLRNFETLNSGFLRTKKRHAYPSMNH